MEALTISRFFAQSWNHGQSLSPEVVSALEVEFNSKFDRLACDLPYRFASNVNLVRDNLPTLFSGRLPFVISHGDLCEMNILVNHTTGNITGILDWAEARVLPFGFALWGLENFLGWMDSGGWHYYDCQHELEELFWKTFQEEARGLTSTMLELVKKARMAGLLCRYGFAEGNESFEVVKISDAPSKSYLDAFCSTEYSA